MDFLIADTFTESLARLTADEQKAAKTTAFDLQVNSATPGLQFHKVDKAKDKGFWSVRVNSDLRLIVHRSDDNILLCYVGHHDKAYDWACRRKLETHPRTGAAQLVEIRERVEEIVVPVYVQTEIALPAKPAAAPPRHVFERASDDELLGYGVPTEWLEDVRQATDADLLGLIDHLPAEAAEALLELATGGKPRIPQTVPPASNPFDHPDAQRRFRVMGNVEELERALKYPWEKWTIFLHPEQRHWVERDYSGPARVSGSAGTGKTVVALHRAAWLARTHEDARVLLTTFSDTLANALQTKLRRLLGNEPRLAERIDVLSLEAVGLRLYKAQFGPAALADRETLKTIIRDCAAAVAGNKFGMHFLLGEWEQVVDAWQLDNWEAYRDVARLGRKTRLPEAQRKVLWAIFERVRAELKARKLVTQAEAFTCLANCSQTQLRGPIPLGAPASLPASSPSVVQRPRAGRDAGAPRENKTPYDYAVVDEAQDVGVAQLRFFAALGGGRPDALFFASDLGQRIFQQPFSWKSLGVDIRGRSRTLRVNYRTSHQIREQADRLLAPTLTDVDGNVDVRNDTVSVFNGPPPIIRAFNNEDDEVEAVGTWIAENAKGGMLPHEFGVFVRSAGQFQRAIAAVEKSGMGYTILDDHVETKTNHVSISTMHLAKGLEFRAVVVMACDDEVLPLQERIETVGDDADLQEVYDTERHLLYVACTRARDLLLVTSVEPASEFLDDLQKR